MWYPGRQGLPGYLTSILDKNMSTRNPIERFWEKVDRNGPVMSHMDTPCWLWTAGLNDGYGWFRVDKDHVVIASRFIYEYENGPVPKGFQIDHQCRVRPCVRTSHLRLATNKQNCENKSQLRGVFWDKRCEKWAGRVRHHGKAYYTEYFKTESEAAIAIQQLRNRLYTHNALDRRR